MAGELILAVPSMGDGGCWMASALGISATATASLWSRSPMARLLTSAPSTTRLTWKAISHTGESACLAWRAGPHRRRNRRRGLSPGVRPSRHQGLLRGRNARIRRCGPDGSGRQRHGDGCPSRVHWPLGLTGHRADHPGRAFTLAVASGKGGTGKTLLATNISALAARDGISVVLAVVMPRLRTITSSLARPRPRSPLSSRSSHPSMHSTARRVGFAGTPASFAPFACSARRLSSSRSCAAGAACVLTSARLTP